MATYEKALSFFFLLFFMIFLLFNKIKNIKILADSGKEIVDFLTVGSPLVRKSMISLLQPLLW